MESPFELFPRGIQKHGTEWRRAYVNDPNNLCPGKDPLDQKCTCPDIMYSTRIRLLTGTTVGSRLYCGCCDLEIMKPCPHRPQP